MLRSILVAAALAAAGPSHADAIARHGADWVRLTLQACKDPRVVPVVEAAGEHPDGMRAAVAHLGGRDCIACWRPAPGGAFLLYEDGDQGLVPLSDLRPAPEA